MHVMSQQQSQNTDYGVGETMLRKVIVGQAAELAPS
jgi:hypothetical protein